MHKDTSKNLINEQRLIPLALGAAALMLFANAGMAQAADAGSAFTGPNAILNKSCSTVDTIKNWIFMISYILGAIGLVVIAISAFIGRFKFSHLIALGGGLFIVAGSDALISFATGGKTAACTVMP